MSPGSENRIRRILIGMDPGSDHRSLLNTAREIAEAVNAELFGHFVEESSLLNASSFPFSRTIIEGATQTRALSFEEMEKAIKLQARRFERALSTLEIETDLSCSIHISSGDFLTEIQSSASDQDLVIIQGTPSGFTISSMMQDIRDLAKGAGVVAICPGKLQTCQGPVIILDEGNEDGLGTSFDLAHSLSQSNRVPVILLQLAGSPESQAALTSQNNIQNQNIQKIMLTDWNIETLGETLRQYQPGYVIGNLNSQLFSDERLTRIILRNIQAPLILFH